MHVAMGLKIVEMGNALLVNKLYLPVATHNKKAFDG